MFREAISSSRALAHVKNFNFSSKLEVKKLLPVTFLFSRRLLPAFRPSLSFSYSLRKIDKIVGSRKDRERKKKRGRTFKSSSSSSVAVAVTPKYHQSSRGETIEYCARAANSCRFVALSRAVVCGCSALTARTKSQMIFKDIYMFINLCQSCQSRMSRGMIQPDYEISFEMGIW